ncbi:MAG: type 4a pilus biogenesis protein PilO [Elusimicrobia bacterium]|nr:type 4a pilus biogenesis protein PilO [Elusimicrobiota bacterium]MBI3012150.1 type 4a pilus biogenesis protein PilO [Elusimicrobiota bacterium]
MDKKQMQMLILFLPVTLLAGLFSYYKYFYSPLAAQRKSLKQELEQIKKDYQESKARVARLPKLQQEIALLNQEISEIEKKLPANKDVPGLIRLLSKKMEAHSITWNRLAPGTQVTKEYYIEHAYTIPFTTSFHSLASFLAEVGQMERIFATRFTRLMAVTNAKTLATEVQGELSFLIYTSKG